ncbi:fumarylacetoacetate hydrolase family protein [Microbacterium sp. RD1]|uniref:fumarylacetoacetate hydrolase family protein n=1 Tax=Microbacterium sp. RD1 TaxID=3457313 RepID=UPI003FA59F87
MRIANLAGRAVLVADGRAVDIAGASSGRFGPDPQSVFESWSDVLDWARRAELPRGDEFDYAALGAPVPSPRQIFAIGLNYADHAAESNLAHPDALVVFTKFVSSLAGPVSTVALPRGAVDWEAELVAVIGREVHDIDAVEADTAIAGFAVGQDLSERHMQLRGPAPQFGLAKSFPGFSPFGPFVVSADEISDVSRLRITAVVEGPTASEHDGRWTVQDGNTADMIFSVARIVSDLSRVVTLYPGDLIFTGTPAGVGAARGVALQAGDTLTTTIEPIGTITSTFVA